MQVRVITLATAMLLASTMLVSAQGRKGDEGPAGGQGQGAQQSAPAESKSQAGQPRAGQQAGERRGSEAPKEAQSAEPKGQEKGKADRRAAEPGAKQNAPEKGKADRRTAEPDAKQNAPEKGKADRRTAEPDGKQNAPEKGKADRRTAEPDGKKGSQPADKSTAGQSKQDPAKSVSDKDRAPGDSQRAGPGKAGTAGGQASADGQAQRVEVDDQKRTRVREVFRAQRDRVRHHTNINVSIDVGRRLPRTLTYYEVPEYIVEIEPRYRGHRFVWVEDRYVIVEPATFVVVGWVEAETGYIYVSSGGSSRSAAADGDRCQVELDRSERRQVMALVNAHRPMTLPGISIGVNVPDTVEILAFPEPVRREVRDIADCRFVVLPNNRVAIVEPSSRRIVTIVDER
ncbi:MAG: DUF1236 domain-containing protein [Hyphomicrobiaceae bacterium]|nr:DUF1236 domain-containing protein [Hyphomicrobiaceae bacterium]